MTIEELDQIAKSERAESAKFDHEINVCMGTGCMSQHSDKLVAAAEKRLGVPQGQTTKDGKISLMTARCVGACGRAPVVLTDGELMGQMTGEQMLEQLERWAVE